MQKEMNNIDEVVTFQQGSDMDTEKVDKDMPLHDLQNEATVEDKNDSNTHLDNHTVKTKQEQELPPTEKEIGTLNSSPVDDGLIVRDVRGNITVLPGEDGQHNAQRMLNANLHNREMLDATAVDTKISASDTKAFQTKTSLDSKTVDTTKATEMGTIETELRGNVSSSHGDRDVTDGQHNAPGMQDSEIMDNNKEDTTLTDTNKSAYDPFDTDQILAEVLQSLVMDIAKLDGHHQQENLQATLSQNPKEADIKMETTNVDMMQLHNTDGTTDILKVQSNVDQENKTPPDEPTSSEDTGDQSPICLSDSSPGKKTDKHKLSDAEKNLASQLKKMEPTMALITTTEETVFDSFFQTLSAFPTV